MRNNTSRRKKAVPTTLAGVLALVIGLIINHYRGASSAPPAGPNSPPPAAQRRAPSVQNETRPSIASKPQPTNRSSSVGWTSRASLESHFQKHGREFGGITSNEYLQQAKELRDANTSATVLEIVRRDGVITRFDKSTGGFIAFNRDKTIRTFFRPDDGERYFRRQAERVDQFDD